jgi:CHAT domain-containing protein
MQAFMLYRYLIIVISLFLCFSCKQETKSSLNKQIDADTTIIAGYFNSGKIDSAQSLANKKLDQLYKLHKYKDYVSLNQWLAGKLLTQPAMARAAASYYKNIFSLDGLSFLDTFSKEAITNAYYQWAAEIGYRKFLRQDDSILICLEKAISLHKKFTSLTIGDEKYSYQILGILYNQLGDVKKSLQYYDLQLALIDPLKYDAIARTTINKAIALKDIDMMDSAINIAKKVLSYPGIIPIRRANLLTVLAEAQSKNNHFSEAYINVAKALIILDTLPIETADLNEKRSFTLKQKGIIENLTKEYSKAIRTQLDAINYYKKTGNSRSRELAKIYIELGKSYIENHLYDSALQSFQIALHIVAPVDSVNYFSLPLKSQLNSENTIMEALDAKAGVFTKKFSLLKDIKYLESATQCYDLSFEVERKLMMNFSYDQSKQLMLKVSRDRSEKAINLCFLLFQITKNESWKEKAFQFAEKSKAFILLESIKRNMAANSGLRNDTLFQKVQTLQTRLSYTDKMIFEAGIVKNDSLLAILKKQKNTQNRDLLLANNELIRSNKSFINTTEKADSTSISIVQKSLPDNQTALLEFFTGDSSTYIFILTKNSPLLFFKATDSLATSINHVLQFYTDKNKINNEPEAYQAAAYQLYQQTGLSTIDNDKIKKLVIIPDGQLNFVPFDALVTSIKPQQNPRMFSYLLLQNQISYGYSVATLLKQAGNNATASASGLSLFAPVFANKERGKTPLLHSMEEADAIKKENSSGKFYLKEQAGINQFKKAVTNAGIIHIASHASADTGSGRQPLIDFYDSSLYLNEIYSMHMAPRLVVLSACETGIGIIDKSEGAMSLARAFYYAGAKNIITSLWSVDDKSTAALFSQFYAGIKTDDYSRALYDSKLNYLKNATSSTASPYYWAGFIHIGNQKQHGNNNRPVLIISILAIAIFSFFILLKRK